MIAADGKFLATSLANVGPVSKAPLSTIAPSFTFCLKPSKLALTPLPVLFKQSAIFASRPFSNYIIFRLAYVRVATIILASVLIVVAFSRPSPNA